MAQIGAGTDIAALHKDLHGCEGVKEVFYLAGPTDIVCRIEAADVAAVTQTVMRIRAVKGIASTDTRFILPIS